MVIKRSFLFVRSARSSLQDSFVCTVSTLFPWGVGGVLSLQSYEKTEEKNWGCKALRALQWYPLVSWRCFRNMAPDCEGDSDRVFDKHSADTFPPRKGLTVRQPSL